MNRLTFLALSALLLSPVNLLAQVTRVEVDWEIRVKEPDSEAVSPQISIIMANRRDLSGDFAEFRINPDYRGTVGGVKIDTWRGPQELDETSHLARAPLSETGDQLKFTTVAEVDSDKTKYSMVGLQSNSWGNVADFEIAPCRTAGAGVIRYSVNLTINESEVEFGHNRVEYIIAREVRYFIGEDLAKRDRTGYYIFRDGESYVGPISPEEVIDTFIAY